MPYVCVGYCHYHLMARSIQWDPWWYLQQLLLMWKLHNVLGINILETHHIHPQLCGWVSAGVKQCVNTCEWWNKQLEFIPKYISLWREHKKLPIIGCIVLISSNNPGICDPFFFITWWNKTKLKLSIHNWGGFSVVVVAQVVLLTSPTFCLHVLRFFILWGDSEVNDGWFFPHLIDGCIVLTPKQAVAIVSTGIQWTQGGSEAWCLLHAVTLQVVRLTQLCCGCEAHSHVLQLCASLSTFCSSSHSIRISEVNLGLFLPDVVIVWSCFFYLPALHSLWTHFKFPELGLMFEPLTSPIHMHTFSFPQLVKGLKYAGHICGRSSNIWISVACWAGLFWI